jgi:hypothetical protein
VLVPLYWCLLESVRLFTRKCYSEDATGSCPKERFHRIVLFRQAEYSCFMFSPKVATLISQIFSIMDRPIWKKQTWFLHVRSHNHDGSKVLSKFEKHYLSEDCTDSIHEARIHMAFRPLWGWRESSRIGRSNRIIQFETRLPTCETASLLTPFRASSRTGPAVSPESLRMGRIYSWMK